VEAVVAVSKSPYHLDIRVQGLKVTTAIFSRNICSTTKIRTECPPNARLEHYGHSNLHDSFVKAIFVTSDWNFQGCILFSETSGGPTLCCFPQMKVRVMFAMSEDCSFVYDEKIWLTHRWSHPCLCVCCVLGIIRTIPCTFEGSECVCVRTMLCTVACKLMAYRCRKLDYVNGTIA
jgi:hypothetical protein